jgi:hypothetical protein
MLLFRSYIIILNYVNIQGVIESCTDILTTSYWLHDIYFLSYNFF